MEPFDKRTLKDLIFVVSVGALSFSAASYWIPNLFELEPNEAYPTPTLSPSEFKSLRDEVNVLLAQNKTELTIIEDRGNVSHADALYEHLKFAAEHYRPLQYRTSSKNPFTEAKELRNIFRENNLDSYTIKLNSMDTEVWVYYDEHLIAKITYLAHSTEPEQPQNSPLIAILVSLAPNESNKDFLMLKEPLNFAIEAYSPFALEQAHAAGLNWHEVIWDRRQEDKSNTIDVPLPFVSSVLSNSDEKWPNQIVIGSSKEASSAYFIYDGPKQDWELRKVRALTRAQNEGNAILWLERNELNAQELEQWMKAVQKKGYRLGFVSEAIAMQRHQIYQYQP
ncbi:MAG: hypothetical protein CMK59_12295 [Proteobacteria bacterium]|nr:hypothetical protein [Pseudomonadota bacterium]